jgi:hypothetical protein
MLHYDPELVDQHHDRTSGNTVYSYRDAESPLSESVSFILPGYNVQAMCVLAKHNMIALLVSAKPGASVAYADGVHLHSLTSGKLQRVIQVRRATHMCITHPEADSVLLITKRHRCVIELFLFGEPAIRDRGQIRPIEKGVGAAAKKRKLPTRLIGKLPFIASSFYIAANREVIVILRSLASQWYNDTHVTFISYVDGTEKDDFRCGVPGLDAITLLPPASDLLYDGISDGKSDVVQSVKIEPGGGMGRATQVVGIDSLPIDDSFSHRDATAVAVDVAVKPGYVRSTDRQYVDAQLEYTYYIAYAPKYPDAPGYIAKVVSNKSDGANRIKAVYGVYTDYWYRSDKDERDVPIDKYGIDIPVFTNVEFNRPKIVCVAPDKGLVVHDLDSAGEARVRVLTRPSKLRMDWLSMLVMQQLENSYKTFVHDEEW